MQSTILTILLAIRVLCIGNSFSWDAVEQELVPLCDAKGIEVEVHNLYYGGCSLAQHADFLMRDTAAYSHRVCTNLSPSLYERDGERFRLVKDTISLRQALRDGKYDFISLQQASHDSGIRSSYEPWLSLLIDTVLAELVMRGVPVVSKQTGDAVAPGQLVPGLAVEGSHVQVDRGMACSIPGCFACGDITGTPYQYIKAAGEGNVAALSAVAYLDQLSRSK